MAANASHTRAPIYYRIQLDILDQLQHGVLRPGEQLPSEADLAERYQVSRITAKRALDELVKQGRAFRQQGRGTFVAQAQIRDISGLVSFSQDVTSRGFVPSAQVLEFQEVEPQADVRELLRLQEGERAFLLRRLRLASGEPVAVETAHITARLCPGLLHEDFTRASLYSVLREKYQVVPTWADAEIQAMAATKQEASLLKSRAGQPVLVARRLTFAANYDVIESVRSVYRGDRFTFYTGRQYIA